MSIHSPMCCLLFKLTRRETENRYRRPRILLFEEAGLLPTPVTIRDMMGLTVLPRQKILSKQVLEMNQNCDFQSPKYIKKSVTQFSQENQTQSNRELPQQGREENRTKTGLKNERRQLWRAGAWCQKLGPREAGEEWLTLRHRLAVGALFLLQDTAFPPSTSILCTGHGHTTNTAQVPSISPGHGGEEFKSAHFETKPRQSNESSTRAGNLVYLVCHCTLHPAAAQCSMNELIHQSTYCGVHDETTKQIQDYSRKVHA